VAAEAYARVSGLPGVVNVTTDRAHQRAQRGLRAWTTPIPMLVVSARSSVKLHARAGITGLRNSETRKPTSSPWSRTLPNMPVLVDDPSFIRYH